MDTVLPRSCIVLYQMIYQWMMGERGGGCAVTICNDLVLDNQSLPIKSMKNRIAE